MRLLVISCFAALAATAGELPDAYRVIVQRNIFNANRVPAPTVRPDSVALPVPPPPSPPTVTVALTGVLVIDGEATALLSSTDPELSGERRVGDALGAWRVASILTTGISLVDEAGEQALLPVGKAIARTGDQPWRLSEERPAYSRPAQSSGPSSPSTSAASSTSSSSSSTAAGAGESGGSEADILKRMMERRQRELNR